MIIDSKVYTDFRGDKSMEGVPYDGFNSAPTENRIYHKHTEHWVH